MGSGAERRFVREALLALGSERPGLRDAARAVRDWDRVLSIARADSVAESVGAAVALRGVEQEIPEPAREAFRDAHEDATARNALLLSEAAAIQAAFTAAGIESVILKGPGLLVAHYPDIGARYVGDIDILVREADAKHADLVARGMGARPKCHEPDPFLDGKHAHCHLLPLVTSRGVVLEIHTGLPGANGSSLRPEWIFNRAWDAPWRTETLRIPSAPDLAAMACLHVFEYHGGQREYLPRHLADIAVLMSFGGSRWGDVEACIGDGPGRWGMNVSRRLLEDDHFRYGEWRHQVGARARGWVKLFAMLDGGVRLRVVFPPRAFMAGRYGVDLESKLLPLLYLWRPVRGAWRFLTGR